MDFRHFRELQSLTSLLNMTFNHNKTTILPFTLTAMVIPVISCSPNSILCFGPYFHRGFHIPPLVIGFSYSYKSLDPASFLRPLCYQFIPASGRGGFHLNWIYLQYCPWQITDYMNSRYIGALFFLLHYPVSLHKYKMLIVHGDSIQDKQIKSVLKCLF